MELWGGQRQQVFRLASPSPTSAATFKASSLDTLQSVQVYSGIMHELRASNQPATTTVPVWAAASAWHMVTSDHA